MASVSAGPAGVFARKSNGRVYYLKNSRGVVHPSNQLLIQQDWEEVKMVNAFLFILLYLELVYG